MGVFGSCHVIVAELVVEVSSTSPYSSTTLVSIPIKA